MIRKMSIKKLTVCSLVLFTLLVLYLFPSEENKLDVKEELNYVYTSQNKETIYLLDFNNYLAKASIETSNNDIETKAKELIEALIEGGSMEDKIPNGFKGIIPANTEILSLEYSNNLIKVNFNKELLNTSIDFEEKIIESLVYTLTSIDEVRYIMILINGEVLSRLPKSKILLPSTLDKSFGINKEYNIDKMKNTSKTTIYYINKYNDTEYYIPVTKITNDTRDKIEIIIDELSSNNIYKTNLMSYLHNNTELMSVLEKENNMILEFNDYIFNDIDEKEILEEVIYTISLSIMDNYDNIEEVYFNVNNEEITKTVLKSIE